MTPFDNSTGPMPLDERAARRERHRVKYDPTINLGHLLTFVGFLVTGTAGYFDLRERIALNEAHNVATRNTVDVEKGRNREDVSELKSDVREVRNGIQVLLLRDRPPAKPP